MSGILHGKITFCSSDYRTEGSLFTLLSVLSLTSICFTVFIISNSYYNKHRHYMSLSVFYEPRRIKHQHRQRLKSGYITKPTY